MKRITTDELKEACKRIEGLHPADTGCELHPKCLDCPFPKCKEDIPATKKVGIKRQETIQKLKAKGKKTKEIASIVGLSVRTVRKYL